MPRRIPLSELILSMPYSDNGIANADIQRDGIANPAERCIVNFVRLRIKRIIKRL